VVYRQVPLIFQRVYLLSLSLLLLCQSCQSVILPVAPEITIEPAPDRAEILFINGDFENSLLEYKQRYEYSLSPEDKNLALYGLACTQLMLARTESQVIEAINNLQKWDAGKGSAPFVENHHLLVFALKQQAELLQQKNQNILLREKNKNSLISSQKKKITQMVTMVEKLQKQLEELEAVDEVSQEQKKPQ